MANLLFIGVGEPTRDKPVSDSYELVLKTAEEAKEKVKIIYICNRTRESAERAVESLRRATLTQTLPQTGASLRFNTIQKENVESILNEVDVTVFSLESEPGWRNSTVTQNSIEWYKKNERPVKEYAELFGKKNYKGITVMFTNPVDLLAYHFLAESGLEYGSIVGYSDNDTRRIRGICGRNDVYAIGPHGGNIVPIGIPFEEGKLDRKAIMKEYNMQRMYWKEISSKDTHKPFAEFMKALLDKKDTTYDGTSSVYVNFPGDLLGVYMGWKIKVVQNSEGRKRVIADKDFPYEGILDIPDIGVTFNEAGIQAKNKPAPTHEALKNMEKILGGLR